MNWYNSFFNYAKTIRFRKIAFNFATVNRLKHNFNKEIKMAGMVLFF